MYYAQTRRMLLRISMSLFKPMGLISLKALDTFGNIVKQVLLLGVSRHMHKIKRKFGLVVEVARDMEKHLCRTSYVLSDALNSRPRQRSVIQFKYYCSEKLLLTLHCSLPSKFLLTIIAL